MEDYVQCTDRQMFPDRKRTDVMAQDFGAKDVLVLFILKASAQCSIVKVLTHFNIFVSHFCLNSFIIDTGLPTARMFDPQGFE